MQERSREGLFWWLFIIVSLLFYARSWTNYFASDDYLLMGRIGFAEAASYFKKSFGYGNEYRPLLPFSYMLDQALSKGSPVGFHITNTLIHITNAILVGRLSMVLGASAYAGALAAAIFLVNPVAHEAVVWISGRPVVLSAFFVFLSLWLFLRFVAVNRSAWCFASVTSFVLGLLTYEGAVVVPFLLGVYWVLAPLDYRRNAGRALIWYFFILAVYIIFWNLLFGGKITRFPTESSLAGAARSFWALIRRTFHGSSQGIPAALYLLLSAFFVRTSQGRRIWAVSLIGMVAAYLPFFIVRGYADRFAYMASAAAAGLLASMVLSLGRYRRGGALVLILAMVLLAYYGYIMQKRITAWKEAGELAKQIAWGIKNLRPNLPPGAVLYVNNVPIMHKDAYVYLTGLQPAVQHLYPSVPLTVIQNSSRVPAQKRPSTFLFQFGNGVIREIQQE